MTAIDYIALGIAAVIILGSIGVVMVEILRRDDDE